MSDSPTVSIVLLGDASSGKSTFLSRLTLGHTNTSTDAALPPLYRDLDQPFVYDIRLYNRAYRFEFSDTASPENYTLLQPDVVIICFDIGRQESLHNAKEVWMKEIYRVYKRSREDVPVLLLGLKRDLRGVGKEWVDPLEGYRYAQEMRCDRYAECSASTGELVNEVFEDIARTAALTTTPAGGQTAGGCGLM